MMGRFPWPGQDGRYWLLNDIIHMDEATIRSHWIFASQFPWRSGCQSACGGGDIPLVQLFCLLEGFVIYNDVSNC